MCCLHRTKIPKIWHPRHFTDRFTGFYIVNPRNKCYDVGKNIISED